MVSQLYRVRALTRITVSCATVVREEFPPAAYLPMRLAWFSRCGGAGVVSVATR